MPNIASFHLSINQEHQTEIDLPCACFTGKQQSFPFEKSTVVGILPRQKIFEWTSEFNIILIGGYIYSNCKYNMCLFNCPVIKPEKYSLLILLRALLEA